MGVKVLNDDKNKESTTKLRGFLIRLISTILLSFTLTTTRLRFNKKCSIINDRVKEV